MIETDLNIPSIDPKTELELLDQAQIKAFEVSGGKLSDFSIGSPIVALLEAQVFCASELLFYLNKILPVLALQFYANFGIKKRLGAFAVGGATVFLNNAVSETFIIPAGFELINNGLIYKTTGVLTIEANNTFGTVDVKADDVGSAGNLIAGSDFDLSQALSNVDRVTTEGGLNGGADEEDMTDLINRASQEIRGNSLVSATDYEQHAKNIIGGSSKFKCVGNLDRDRISFKLGVAHLFGINGDGSPISLTQSNIVENELKPFIHIGSEVIVSPIEITPLDVVFDLVTNRTDVSLLTTLVQNELISYFSVDRQGISEPFYLNEIEYLIRKVVGINRVIKVTLNGVEDSLIPNNKYTFYKVVSIRTKFYNQDVLVGDNTTVY